MRGPAMHRTIDLASRYLFPTYARAPIVIVSGRGCRVVDADGREYLDLLGGIAVNALGHAHPRILEALREATESDETILHCSNLYHHPFQAPLAARLAELLDLPRVFFCNSGSEAIEAALKIARAHARRTKGDEALGIVALEGSFHGRTAFALSATGRDDYRAPFGPLVENVAFVPPDDARALTRAVTGRTAAVLLEPVQGEGGVQPIDDAVLKAARTACDDVGALLIADEVQCGLGRTGAWSACRQSGVAPDLITLAKPLAAGLPLGAVVGREELAVDLGPGMHGSTFGGGPLPCRLALAFLDAVDGEGLLDAVAARGRQLIEGLQSLASRHGVLRKVRGRGLMIGVEMEHPVEPILDRLRERGILAGSAGRNVLRLLPPFVVSVEEIDRFLDTFDGVLTLDATTGDRNAAAGVPEAGGRS